jgi:hypothetical protein
MYRIEREGDVCDNIRFSVRVRGIFEFTKMGVGLTEKYDF